MWKVYRNDSTIAYMHTQVMHHSDGSDDPEYDFQIGSSQILNIIMTHVCAC